MATTVTNIVSRVVVRRLGGNPPRFVATRYVTYNITKYASAPKMIISTLITNVISKITAVKINYYLGSDIYTSITIPTSITTTKPVTHIVTKIVSQPGTGGSSSSQSTSGTGTRQHRGTAIPT
ncbi:MAG: hypothetical protein GXO43_05790 [Crenarchaeota archaeon]|nr:hypothetical protein [Thermoproteota archaeon]